MSCTILSGCPKFTKETSHCPKRRDRNHQSVEVILLIPWEYLADPIIPRFPGRSGYLPVCQQVWSRPELIFSAGMNQSKGKAVWNMFGKSSRWQLRVVSKVSVYPRTLLLSLASVTGKSKPLFEHFSVSTLAA